MYTDHKATTGEVLTPENPDQGTAAVEELTEENSDEEDDFNSAAEDDTESVLSGPNPEAVLPDERR